MTTTAIDATARERTRIPPAAQLLLYGALLLGVGWLGVAIRPSDGSTALWWPGAGIAVAGLLLIVRHRRPHAVVVLVLAGAASGTLGGRPLLVAILLASINAVGAVVVVVGLSWRRSAPRRFRELEDLARVLAATLAGAVTAGLTAGIVAATTLGAGFVASAVAVAASHAAAVLLLMPFVLRVPDLPVEATRLELVAQWAATAVVTAVVVAPTHQLPLAFLLIPVLLWPALRSSLRTTGAQLLTVGLLASILTLRGGGPFPRATATAMRADRTTVALVQLLVIVMASVLLAVVVTVTHRRSLMRDISRREELFRVGFSRSLLGLLLLRPEEGDLRIVELNGVAARLLGGPPERFVDASWTASFQPADRQRVRDAVERMAREGDAGWHGEIHLTSDEIDRWVEVAVSPAVAGTAVGELLTVQMVDITARRAAEARLSDLALRDGLTGLANRMLLDDRLDLALADAERAGRRVGVMFLDLDDFKEVNDTYGHAAGDAVLVEVAARLVAAVRPTDTVARVGGDEFIVVCPNLTSEDELRELVERVRAAVVTPMAIEGAVRSPTASIGAAVSRSGAGAADLLHLADADMYTHKARRRLELPT